MADDGRLNVQNARNLSLRHENAAHVQVHVQEPGHDGVVQQTLVVSKPTGNGFSEVVEPGTRQERQPTAHDLPVHLTPSREGANVGGGLLSKFPRGTDYEYPFPLRDVAEAIR